MSRRMVPLDWALEWVDAALEAEEEAEELRRIATFLFYGYCRLLDVAGFAQHELERRFSEDKAA